MLHLGRVRDDPASQPGRGILGRRQRAVSEPPVSDSATAMVSPRSRTVAPTCSASGRSGVARGCVGHSFGHLDGATRVARYQPLNTIAAAAAARPHAGPAPLPRIPTPMGVDSTSIRRQRVGHFVAWSLGSALRSSAGAPTGSAAALSYRGAMPGRTCREVHSSTGLRVAQAAVTSAHRTCDEDALDDLTRPPRSIWAHARPLPPAGLGHPRRARLELQVERDALVHRLGRIDQTLLGLTDERHSIVDALAALRDDLYPPVPWCRRLRPPDLDRPPLPPVPPGAPELRGRALRADLPRHPAPARRHPATRPPRPPPPLRLPHRRRRPRHRPIRRPRL